MTLPESFRNAARSKGTKTWIDLRMVDVVRKKKRKHFVYRGRNKILLNLRVKVTNPKNKKPTSVSVRERMQGLSAKSHRKEIGFWISLKKSGTGWNNCSILDK